MSEILWRGLNDIYSGPEYRAYSGARQRCTNPKNPEWGRYGARGIEFRFTSFKQFLTEIGLRPQGMMLDRKNNDGHYELGNVHWVFPIKSAQNRRQTFGKGCRGKSNGMFGKKRPDLAKWNSENLRGNPRGPMSDETKRRISEIKRQWWAERKQRA